MASIEERIENKMASIEERIENTHLGDFPWGLIVETLEKMNFHQLVLFQENIDPVALPKLLASSLRKCHVVNLRDLILMNEQLPTMFRNPQFTRNLPKTMKIEIAE